MNQFFKLSSRKLVFGTIAVVSTAFVGSKRLSIKDELYFTSDQVQKFDGTNGKPMYITFRGGVYDVTNFKDQHPGGNFIDQAAGGDVESFWKKWAYHYQSKKVWSVLKENRVGTLVENDIVQSKNNDVIARNDVPIDML